VPLFQISGEDLLGHVETGEEVRSTDGRVRRLNRVSLRRACGAIQLEYVLLEVALGAIPDFVVDTNSIASATVGDEDCGVILIDP
jgi:hypothetical protein